MKKIPRKVMDEFSRLASELHEYHGDRYLALCEAEGIKDPPPVDWFTHFDKGDLVTTCDILWPDGLVESVPLADYYGDHSVLVVAAVKLRLSRN